MKLGYRDGGDLEGAEGGKEYDHNIFYVILKG